jgi:hypothetical protein
VSLLLLFQGAGTGAPPPPPVVQQVGASAEGMFISHKEAREAREYQQWLRDEEAVITFVISQID